MEYAWLVWDILAVAVIAVLVYQAAKRGFIRTAVSWAGYLISVVVANFASPHVAAWLYDNIVRDALRMVLVNRFDKLITEGGTAAGSLIDAVPDSLKRIIEASGAIDSGTMDSVDSIAHSEAAVIIEELIDMALRDPIMTILQGISFLALFTLMVVAVKYFSRLLTSVYKIPVIGTVNTLLGGIFGVLQSLLALFIGALVFNVLIAATGGFTWMNSQVLDETYILRVFVNILNF